MAGNIKGINIEIGGETQKLTQALDGINQKSRDLQGELKQVERLLKMEPGNVELLTQRQTLLAEAVEETKNKMTVLREADAQLDRQFANGEVTTEEYAEQHRALQREIIQTGQRLEDLEDQSSRCNVRLEAFAAKADQAGKKMTAAGKMIAPASAAIAGIGTAAVKVTADFDESMSQVAATMGITVEEIAKGSEAYEALRQAAKDAGESTKFSASEAAEALNYLALAGYDYQKACDALVPILNLAAAGTMDLAAASDMVTDSMSALGIEATTDNLVAFGDQLVKASQKSNTSVAQLGEAILTVGGTAKQMAGGTIEMATALGVLADNGIKASEGGTHLRNIILAMTPTTDPAIQAFNDLGVASYDAAGNLRPLNETLRDLNIALSEYTAEEKQQYLTAIFNKTDLAAVTGLLTNTATNVDELNEALEAAGITVEETGINITILQKAFAETDSMEEFIADMTKAGLTSEQAQVAYNGLNAVLNEGGSRFEQLSGYIADSNGAMQSAADVQIDNLKGQLTILGSQLEGLGITVGEVLMPIIRSIVGAVQDFLAKLASIDPQLQTVIIVMGAVVAALGPLLLLFGAMASSITALIAIVPAVTGGISAIGAAMTALAANPLGGLIAGITALIAIFAALWATNEQFRDDFVNLLKSLISFITTSINNIINLFKSAFNVIGVALRAFANLMRGDFSGFLNDTINLVTQAIPNMFSAGWDLLSGFWDGMKGVWSSICTWVADTVSWLADKLTFWRSGKAEMEADKGGGELSRVDGSHASGLAYVPFDGYIAELHKGEAVVPASQNPYITGGEVKFYNNFAITGGVRSDRDIEMIAQKVNNLQVKAARSRGVRI